MRIVHISDTHFGTEVPDVVNALVHAIHDIQPGLIILSGDITQRAKHSEFASANRFLQSLPDAPLLIVPGNHDLPLFNLWQRFTAPYSHYLNLQSAAFNPVFENPQLLVIGVKTTSRFRHVNGRISEKQISEVAECLRQAPPSTRKLVVCHHPFDYVLESDKKNLIQGAGKALRVWSEAGLDYILGGHIHYPFVSTARVRHPDILYDTRIVQAGTACSSRVRSNQANAFNLLELSAQDDHLFRYDYDGISKTFICRPLL
jgi:3',5'-cyclic AMP phosphodiesterase CpdA